MYYTIKTLLSQGKSHREISRQLGIHRNTVKGISVRLDSGHLQPPEATRKRKLDDYAEEIRVRMNSETARLIYEWIHFEQGVEVSYTTVSRFVRKLKGKGEVYIPVHTSPGEEAQVDFGYLGYFEHEGKRVKVWSFSMVLGYSRLSHHELVLDQRVSTFIRCHIQAFEYFGGVPSQVKIDNLKSGVIEANFYEPLIQAQYAEFLAHYGSVAITARPGRGQDKGKVESSVKYVKSNFLKRIKHRNFSLARKDIRHWQDEICNLRVHGTTRKVPRQVYNVEEKSRMLPLPPVRYECFDVTSRKVNQMGHISFQHNYYSVPWHWVGENVTVRSNGYIVRICFKEAPGVIHALCAQKGRYITREEHKPPYKQTKSETYYQENMEAIGPDAAIFYQALREYRPRHWYDLVRGVLSLRKKYQPEEINAACKRALSYQALSYREVKEILIQQLHLEEMPAESPTDLGGYGHALTAYDQLI